jgi:hypothetical protein
MNCKCGKLATWSEFCEDCWENYSDAMWWAFVVEIDTAINEERIQN